MGTTTDAPGSAAQWERRAQVRLNRGEAAALGEIYDRHARLVHAMAARLTGDDKAAREVVATVFTRLWQHPEAFDPARYRLRTWLATETYERATAHTSGAARSAPAPGHSPAGPVAASGTRTGEPAATAGLLEVTEADSALTSASFRVRSVLRLVHTENRSYRDAAVELGISEEEVLQRLRQGLQLIAEATAAAREGRS
ncbi:sigma factor [Streptomyces sp. Z26]|uniref:RNA polymerase sigma factor n=1 Tax=Streptomyces sp. Z26 TaxID=2500177 RepID=UPI000EF15AF4|nr:sigma factor [Streptomyces sp. Z26]RLL69856.1 hypothetical protein D7M15_27045 [Streptomyces sp. Z26]